MGLSQVRLGNELLLLLLLLLLLYHLFIYRDRGLNVTTHFNLGSSLRKGGVIPPLHLYAVMPCPESHLGTHSNVILPPKKTHSARAMLLSSAVKKLKIKSLGWLLTVPQ